MLIKCPQCQKERNIADNRIPPQGANVRCSCGHTWKLEPPSTQSTSNEESAMKCPRCGYPRRPRALQCPNCKMVYEMAEMQRKSRRWRLEPPVKESAETKSAPTAPSQAPCPKCGYPKVRGARECPKCGVLYIKAGIARSATRKSDYRAPEEITITQREQMLGKLKKSYKKGEITKEKYNETRAQIKAAPLRTDWVRMAPLILLFTISLFFYFKSLGTSHITSGVASKIPSERATGNYTIINDHKLGNIKRSIDIMLSQKVSSDTLRSIAIELRERDPNQYERTFICYYLPGMQVGAGAWATAHFDPGLNVIIFGNY